ncbi:Oligosaccaryltransferase-domain-containing protein [Jimgerdemannia flammicorona]|uniref:Dolichyl-diphosphooligosaccharide--protein glycosyltransferase subunit 4 n=2 Tax=Jimgerdemannia flammicorona TaxID=994334 RepID=A0A433DGG4_9FUNG|nr:Oligosaccaryltransferase-domain-containing protein [Jimgerdemannia flammicorona]RUS34493.1 Oligosaccaryltransferase-domain-containing protein [Jimgerdemannia flammicorona]
MTSAPICPHPIRSYHFEQSPRVSTSLSFNPPPLSSLQQTTIATTMMTITDTQLGTIANVLGSLTMILIVIYHFVNVNSKSKK